MALFVVELKQINTKIDGCMNEKKINIFQRMGFFDDVCGELLNEKSVLVI